MVENYPNNPKLHQTTRTSARVLELRALKMTNESLMRRVQDCFFVVYNDMRFGVPEHAYAGGMEILFREMGINARREHAFDVRFRDQRVGTFRVDFLVEDVLIVELKTGHVLPLARGPSS